MFFCRQRNTMGVKMIINAKILAMNAVVLLFLSGCQTSQESFIGPSGAQVHSAKCSQSPQACFRTATTTCRGAYAVLDSYSNAGGILADVIPGPVTWYNMTYQCGQSSSAFPQFPFRGSQYVPPATSTTQCQRVGNTVNCQSF